MKNASLMQLKVARRHRHMTPEDPAIGKIDLQAIAGDLNTIHNLVEAIRSLRPGSLRKEKVLELRGIVSLDLPETVLALEDGWYEAINSGTEHDRELVRRLQNGGKSEPWLPPEKFGPAVWSGDIPLTEHRGPRESIWQEVLLADALWIGHVQSKIAERLLPLVPENVEMIHARVLERGMNKRTETVFRVHADLWPTTDPCWILAEVNRIMPDRLDPIAKLWFRVQLKKRKGIEAQFLKPLAEVASLLRDAQELRRQVSIPEVGIGALLLKALRAYSKGPSTLLRGLADCVVAMRLWPDDDERRKLVIGKIAAIVAGSDWPDLRRCFLLVVSALQTSQGAKASLYDLFISKCPDQPQRADLLALVSGIQALALPHHWCGIVKSIADSVFGEVVIEKAGGHLRGLLFREPSSPAPHCERIVAALFGAMELHGKPAQAIVVLKPVVESMRVAKEWVPIHQLLQRSADMLSDACPPAKGESPVVLQALWTLEDLRHGIPNAPTLVLGPLPPGPGGKPEYCPDSFWPLVKEWLGGHSRSAAHWTRYQSDFAWWYLYSYRESGTDSISKELVAGCGRWLRETRRKDDLDTFRRLVTEFIVGLEASATSPNANVEERSLTALRSLCQPTAANETFDVIAQSMKLGLWKDQSSDFSREFADRWKRWIEALVLDVADAKTVNAKARWSLFCLRAITLEPQASRLPLWSDSLARCVETADAADKVAWDQCLEDFEVQSNPGLGSAPPTGVERLGWVRRAIAHLMEPQASQWFDWAARMRNPQGPLSNRDSFALQTATLCRSTNNRLRMKVAEIWSKVAVALLQEGRSADVEELMRLCKDSAIPIKDDDRR